jgi:hypothetical protein
MAQDLELVTGAGPVAAWSAKAPALAGPALAVDLIPLRAVEFLPTKGPVAQVTPRAAIPRCPEFP